MRGARDKARAFLQSTPMRLAVALVILFTLVSLISLGASYLVIRNSLEKTMRSNLIQELAGFQAAPSEAAVAALIVAQVAATDPEHRILSYTMSDSRHVGNGIITPSFDGFRTISMPDGEEMSDSPYFALSAELHGGHLVVANSREQIDDLREFFFYILVLSLVPTTIIALAGGMVLARRSARRIEAVSVTLDRLTTGDLSARVPSTSGRRDDLSSIATRLDRMARAQQSSVAALKQISANIAHDLKTPIQRVSLMLNQARQAPGLTSELEDLILRAGRETDGIVSTFQSLLQIAQIEGGSPRSRFKPVNLGELATTFVEVYEPAAEESDHRITLSTPQTEACIVAGEKGLLGQVLANLIENALRHTPRGSKIDVSVSQIRDEVTLTIADSGPGISESEHGNVLRRLYRLEQSRTSPGNGLGLSLVAVIAELHDAQLEFGSNEPGLVVRLTFASTHD